MPIMIAVGVPPTGAEEGQVYLDSGVNRSDNMRGFRYYDGAVWIDL